MPLISRYDDKITPKPKKLVSRYDDAQARSKRLVSRYDREIEPLERAQPPDFVAAATEDEFRLPFFAEEAARAVPETPSYAKKIGKKFMGAAALTLPKATLAAEQVKERVFEEVEEATKAITPRPLVTREERARAIAEMTGKPYVPSVTPEKMVREPSPVKEKLEEVVEAGERFWEADLTEAPRWVQQFGMASESLGTMAATLPIGGVKLMAMTSGLAKAKESLDAGEPLQTAMFAGGIQGFTEWATEIDPTNQLLKPGVTFLHRLARGGISDLGGELAATATEMYVIDQKIRGKDAYTKEEWKRALWDTAAVSGIVSTGATAITHPIVARDEAVRRAIEQREVVGKGLVTELGKGFPSHEVGAPPVVEPPIEMDVYKPEALPITEKQKGVIKKLNSKISDLDISISEAIGADRKRLIKDQEDLMERRNKLLNRFIKPDIEASRTDAPTVVPPAAVAEKVPIAEPTTIPTQAEDREVVALPQIELTKEIDKKTPKSDLTGETLEPVDLPKSFENDRAPMDLTESGKRERAKTEIFDEPKVKVEADRTYKQLVRDGLITELTDKDIGKIEKEVMFPHTIAKKFPKFKPIYDIALDMEAQTDSRISNYTKILEPYLNLKNKKNLDAFMIEEDVARGGRMYSAQERLARLTPEENAAWLSFRATTREAKNDLGDMLIELGNDPDKVTSFINKLPDTYVPLSRFGNYQVYVEDRTGEELSYTFHKTRRQAQAEARKWAGKGKVKIGKIKQTSEELLDDIPINMLAGLKAFDEELDTDFTKAYGAIMGRGFPTHLLERKMVRGFETDLTKPISNYLLSIGKYMERKRAKVKFENALAKINPKTESNLFTTSSKYIKYMTSHSKELAKFRQWMFRYYLGGNIKSAILNATQTFTTTVPSFSKYTGNPAIKVAKASNIARYSLETIRKKDANLANALEQAIYDGIISEQFVSMLRGGAYQNLNLNTADKALSFFFNHVEVFNRKVAFIAAYKSATNEGVRIKDTDGKKRKVKLSHNEAIKFAEDFVNETQFNYTKADRPAITRGLKAPAFTFRMFTGNYLSMLKNFITDREFGALARATGMLIALGGVKAIPGARDLINALGHFGYDPEKELREATGKYGDLLLHGALFPTGVDISGAVSTLEMVPRDAQQGAWPAIASIILGVPTDLPKRIDKAIFFAHDLKDPWRAVEAVMPEAVRNPMVAVRWAREGAARTAFGEPIAKPGIGSILLKAASIQPAILTKAYEREHSEKLLSERAKDVSRNMSFMIARAIFNKDREGLSQIFLDISKHNENADSPSELIIVNKRSIKDALANMIYPEAVEIRRMPRKARPEFLEIQETFREQQ